MVVVEVVNVVVVALVRLELLSVPRNAKISDAVFILWLLRIKTKKTSHVDLTE